MYPLAAILSLFESSGGPAAAGLWDRMLEWLQAHKGLAGTIALGSLVVAVLYLGLMSLFIARMSPDYFVSPKPAPGTFRTVHPVVRVLVRVVKNLLGIVFLVAGLAMLVLPGQGALTILVAISLLDFPGKRRLELRIVSQRHVKRSIDWIRARARQPPLNLPRSARPEKARRS